MKSIIISIFVFLFNLALCPGQENPTGHIDIKYYQHDSFLIEGTRIPVAKKDSPFDRLPEAYKEKVREPVWRLSKNSAGISVRFFTNSASIDVKWTVLNNTSMNHMAETGIKGVDLYFRNSGNWQYVNTGRPSGVDNQARMVENMHREMREFRLYLPLYDGITSLQIGVEAGSQFIKPGQPNARPVVFYGTSITQGGCASRPGMAHTNIISRELDIEVINLGFSGNGQMEAAIVELISGIDAAFYVIECVPNMTAEQVEERAIPLVGKIRERNPDTPVILVESLIYENAYLDRERREMIERKNLALKDQYKRILESGVKNVYYISHNNAMGDSHEGTVDGVHFTDLGFKLYADFLLSKFEEFGLINKKTHNR